MTDGLTVICLTLAVNLLTRKIPAFQAVILGTLITALAWLILAFRPTIWGAVLSLFILALGEITQQPRYYEYIALLAPPGQQGTYMGFAFLPIGIGSLIGGWFGGTLMHHFGEVTHQTAMTMITPSYLGETIEYSSLHACRSTLEDPTFLPIGIGSLIGGWFGGTLMHHFGEVTHQPERIWWTVTAVGVATTVLLWIYDRYFRVARPQ